MNKLQDLKDLYEQKLSNSYYKQHIECSENIQKSLSNEITYLRSLKQKTQDPTGNEQTIFSNVAEEKIATLLDEPDLVPLIKSFLPESNRHRLIRNVVDSILARDLPLEEKVNLALKTALGIITEGVVTAPLDGLIEVIIDPIENFLHLQTAGPIRALGGTNCALMVVIAEYIRQKMNIASYVATPEELKRSVVEVTQYIKLHPGQIRPSVEEIDFVVKNCPIMIDGIETEVQEVSLYKYLPRIKKPRIRGSISLIIVEGFIIRAKKVLGLLNEYNIEWPWLYDLTKISTRYRSAGSRSQNESKYALTIGRPLLSSKDRKTGLRLRIGTTPSVGLCGSNVHPYLIDLLKFINIGSQLVTSAPGKASTITGTCEDLERPIVRYTDGIRYYELNTSDKVLEVIDLGQILFAVGDYIQSNNPIPPHDYCRGLWRRHTGYNLDWSTLTEDQILTLNLKYPLCKIHPYYSLFIDALSFEQYNILRNERLRCIRDGIQHLPYTTEIYNLLKKLGCLCTIEKDTIRVKYAKIFDHYMCLDVNVSLFDYYSCKSESEDSLQQINLSFYLNSLLRKNNKMLLSEKGTYIITARVGRCESINLSKVKPRHFNSLSEYEPMKKVESFWTAIEKQPYGYGKYDMRYCYDCNTETCYRLCTRCNKESRSSNYCVRCKTYFECTKTQLKNHKDHKLKTYVSVYRDYSREVELLKDMNLKTYPLKAVCKEAPIKLVSSKRRIPYPEPLVKGYLRSRYKLSCTKDGTIRLTFCNAATTHFTPAMANVTVDQLIKLGYKRDIKGELLTRSNQVLALKLNDCIVSYHAAQYLLKITSFIDDLIKIYYKGTTNYYNVKRYQDLLGVLVGSISPHTSNGTLCRIIGFVDNYCVYMHPVAVAARRRDVDGDMDAIYLMSDLLLNCSKKYVSEGKVGALMSIPLTTSTYYYLDQVGKEVIGRELTSRYYDEVTNWDNTIALSIDQLKLIKSFKTYLSNKVVTEDQIEYNTPGFGLSVGHSHNYYRDATSNVEKLDLVLDLEKKLTFVDQKECILGLLEGHLIPDIMGNFNAYFKQSYKCEFCQEKFLQAPLSVTCPKCKKGKLKHTVYPNMVVKYIEIIKKLRNQTTLPIYLEQKISNILETTECFTEQDTKSDLFTEFI
jgi:DNA polymerase II large subunit